MSATRMRKITPTLLIIHLRAMPFMFVRFFTFRVPAAIVPPPFPGLPGPLRLPTYSRGPTP